MLSLLLIKPIQGQSQVQEKDLIGTWLPILEESLEGEIFDFNNATKLYTFTDANTGFVEIAGSNVITSPFQYYIQSDSIFLEFEEVPPNSTSTHKKAGKILSQNTDQLKISLDSSSVTSLIRFSEYDNHINALDFKEALKGQVWEFQMVLEYDKRSHKILYEFQTETKSRLVSPDFQGSIFQLDVITEDFRKNRGEEFFWTVGQHNGIPLLRIEDLFSGFQSFNYIVKSISKDKMELETYILGKRHKVSAVRKKKPSDRLVRKRRELLTSFNWRFELKLSNNSVSEEIEYLDLGSTHDYFPDTGDAPYKMDTTALILQKDFDQKLLILEFKSDATYTIRREERLLDSGTWKSSFYEKLLTLNSGREERAGDGIYGGHIFIDKIKKDRLQIKRSLFQQSNSSTALEDTSIEIYRPIKKRK